MTRKLEEQEDSIETFWLKLENNEIFEDYAIYTVEIPAKEQNTP